MADNDDGLDDGGYMQAAGYDYDNSTWVWLSTNTDGEIEAR